LFSFWQEIAIMFGRRFRWCLRGLVLLLGSGCGVSDYEARMINAQERMQRYEEETRLLTDPLSIPQVEMGPEKTKVPIFNLFIRAPAGINITPDPEPDPRMPRMSHLYSYRARQPNTGAVELFALAFGDQKEFADNLRRSFSISVNSRKRPVRGPGREETTTFDTYEFPDDQSQYFLSVNLWTGGDDKQIAVIYWLFKGREGATAKDVQMSLESFAVGAEANRQRDLFAKGSPLEVPKHPE
jgi:hypothetical protein